ncbi:MAG: CBS domain-containing protein [Verrucomicrobiota bacterium]
MERVLSEILSDKGGRVVCVHPETSVESAAKTMKRERIGAILVIHDDQLSGIMTERDILNRVVAEGKPPGEIKVSEIMTHDVIVIDPGCTVRQAMQIVSEKRLRHLPVLRDGRLEGMLSAGDLTRSIVEEDEDVIDTLHEFIRGGYPG